MRVQTGSWGRVSSSCIPQGLKDRKWQLTIITMSGIKVKFSLKFTSEELSSKIIHS